MIIEKKINEDKYYSDEMLYNYLNADQHELTVTITLQEYRDLLKAKFNGENQKQKLDWFDQYNRANKAEAQVKELEAQLEAIKRIMPCQGVNQDTNQDE